MRPSRGSAGSGRRPRSGATRWRRQGWWTSSIFILSRKSGDSSRSPSPALDAERRAIKQGSVRVRPLACACRLGAGGAAASDEGGSWRGIRARRIGGFERARSPGRKRCSGRLGRSRFRGPGRHCGAGANSRAARRAAVRTAVHLMMAGRLLRGMRHRAVGRRNGECRPGRQGQRKAEPDQGDEPPHIPMRTQRAKRRQRM